MGSACISVVTKKQKVNSQEQAKPNTKAQKKRVRFMPDDEVIINDASGEHFSTSCEIIETDTDYVKRQVDRSNKKIQKI